MKRHRQQPLCGRAAGCTWNVSDFVKNLHIDGRPYLFHVLTCGRSTSDASGRDADFVPVNVPSTPSKWTTANPRGLSPTASSA